MINSLFWNVRGVGNRPILTRLHKLCRLHELFLVALCEPLLELSHLEYIRVKLNFHHTSANIEGRIRVFCDSSFTAEIVAQSSQFIALRMTHPCMGQEFIAVLIHVACTKEDRAELWRDLALVCSTGLPILMACGFNVILATDEKKGVDFLPRQRRRILSSFLTRRSCVTWVLGI